MGTPFAEWKKDSMLCWIDYETTGVDIESYGVLPIEIGVLFTNMELEPIEGAFTSLINWDFEELNSWEDLCDDAVSAFPFHKITPQEIVARGVGPEKVAAHFVKIVEMLKGNGKCILISDNIQFEWQFTKMLLEAHPDGEGHWPFHYCGWDTSILALVPNLGFEDPPNPPHRAMQDTIDLWRTVRTTLYGPDKIGLDRQMNIGVVSG